ncbi:MAG: hypothetical protein AAB733_02325 [Patescibacteria group bacterium]
MLSALITAIALTSMPTPPIVSPAPTLADPGFVEWIPNNIKGGGGLGDKIVNKLKLEDILRIDEALEIGRRPSTEGDRTAPLGASTTHPE